MGYSFTDLGAEGCCRSLNALFIWLKHLYQYFGSLDTVRKSFLNEAADFNVCICEYVNIKKNKKNDSIVHNGCDFTKQMLSNEQPGSQPSSFYWCTSDEC